MSVINFRSHDGNKELAVILPVHNEEGKIIGLVETWHRELSALGLNFVIVVYDDASTDKTWSLLQGLAHQYSEVKIIKQILNHGYSATLLRGFREYLGYAEWILQLDTDYEIDPAHFKRFWSEREQYDLIQGRRFYFKRHLVHRVLSFWAQIMVRILFGRGIRDVNCSYRLLRSEKFKNCLYFLHPHTAAPNILLTAYALKRKMRIHELWLPMTSFQLRRKRKMVEESWRAFKQTGSYYFQLRR